MDTASAEDYERLISKATEVFKIWRLVPAPHVVRRYVKWVKLYVYKKLNLVQEIIDIADFAVGESRMLYGKTMHSERAQHRMYEQWHPYGPMGLISAFNFPVAVWA